jgi:hypothetical protein
MGGRSKLWLVSAGLLAVAAGLAGAALALYWQPCAANMLTGSVLNGFRLEPEFSTGCLVAMDEASGFPLPVDGWTVVGVLGLFAVALTAAAWLVLLPTVRLSPMGRLVVALPGLVVLGVAVASAAAALDPAGDGLPSWPYLLVEFSMLPALFVLANRGIERALLVRYVVVALGATGIGLFHQMADYILALGLSDANWDSPPGTGAFTAVGMFCAALLIGLLWRLDRPTRVPVGTPSPSPA